MAFVARAAWIRGTALYPLWISLRYLMKRKVTLICIAEVAVGVMALTVVLSVMNGFIRDIRSHVRGTLSDLVVVSRLGPYEVHDYEACMDEVLETEHVVACAPYVEGVAIAKYEGNLREFVHFRGVDPRLQSRVSDWDGQPGQKRTRMAPGRTMDTLLDDTAEGKPVLFGGQELFRRFPKGTKDDAQADPDANFMGFGDPVVLVTVTKSFGRGVRLFRLSGLFKTGMYEFDRMYVYISLKEAQRLVGAKDAVSGISIKVDADANVAGAMQAVQERLGPMFRVVTWQEQRATFLLAVEVERRVMSIILFFILLVAGFSIFAILTMVVMEKAKDIGTLRAIGATRIGVMSIFMILGSIIGVLGSAIGLSAGLALLKSMNRLEDLIFRQYGWRVFPQDVYYLDHIPHEISFRGLAMIVTGALLISFFASLYPAWRAARLDPVETLRYE